MERKRIHRPFGPRATISSGRSQHSSLVKLGIWLGVLSFQMAVATARSSVVDPDEGMLRRRRLEADAQIRERFLLQPHDCMDVIVTVASFSGNTDPDLSLGTSDFQRTNAVAMSCISLQTYTTLLNSPEVLLVEIDARMEPATQTVQSSTAVNLTYVDGEVVTWGASYVLQSMWDAIPDPNLQGPDFAVCVVDSGLLVSHQDIVSKHHAIIPCCAQRTSQPQKSHRLDLPSLQPFDLNDPNIVGTEIDLPPEDEWFNPVSYAYHGTHTVGTMFAQGYNAEGLRGIIPRSDKFKLLIARVFGDQLLASAKTSSIEKAVEWCANNGARVINLSLASNTPTLNSQLLYSRIVEEEDILIVAAAGNLGSADPSYPAAYDHVISVGSIDEDFTKSDFSQYGQSLDLVAPGSNIFSTVPSSGLLADDSTTYDAGPMAFTPVHNDPISGEIIDCGLGDIVCPNADGRVCLVEHSLGLPFQVLASNCENGGGVSLVVYPGVGADGLENAVMELDYTGSISVLTVSRDDGLRLLAKRGTLASISFTVPAYRSVSGTSMSAAHVSSPGQRSCGRQDQVARTFKFDRLWSKLPSTSVLVVETTCLVTVWSKVLMRIITSWVCLRLVAQED
jgi:subtilisin family serine protease